jgi:hypothetical protein
MNFAPSRGNRSYFERPPEKLVLEGYRRWTAGFETGSVAPWELAFGLYTELLGAEHGRRALSDLSHFVRTLRLCAACPLQSFPFGAYHVCRDECLALGLIAALQHRDKPTAKACLGALACPARYAAIGDAAQGFAETLSQLDQTLCPIPQDVITDILSRSMRATFH